MNEEAEGMKVNYWGGSFPFSLSDDKSCTDQLSNRIVK